MSSLLLGLAYGFGLLCAASAVLCFCALRAKKKAQWEEEVEFAAFCAVEADLQHFNTNPVSSDPGTR